MATTKYGDISQRTAYHAAAAMLEHARPIIVLGKFGQQRPIPRNTANQVKFRRPIVFTVNETPLVEGQTPVAHKIRFEDVSVTLSQYGDLVEITDVVNDTSEDPVLNEASMLSGENAAETMEMIAWGVIKAGTNVFYTTATARNTVNTAVAITDQDAIVRNLRSNRARMITRMLAGSADTQTRPVEAAFLCFAHTDMEYDIRAISGFSPVAEYGQRQPVDPNEIGSIRNVRYILSPLLEPYLAAGSATLNGMKSVGGANVDVYPMVYVAQDAWGHVPLAGRERITPTVINPNTIDKSDPLGQRGYVGWKAYYAATVLNQSWMAVLESGATDL